VLQAQVSAIGVNTLRIVCPDLYSPPNYFKTKRGTYATLSPGTMKNGIKAGGDYVFANLVGAVGFFGNGE